MRPAILPLVLAGCMRAPLAVEPPPADLLAPCPTPLALPARDATQAEVERWWGADRSALRACGERHQALGMWAGGVAPTKRAVVP